MVNKPIGILDSGFGGLSIFQTITGLLPHESTVYIGDHAYIPYSKKTAKVIQNRVVKLITFLIGKQAKLIVIACNTATVAGIDVYRKKFPNIPIIGVVPVVKSASAASKRKSFAVLSTVFTAKSSYQKKLLNTYAKGHTVYNLGSHKLVDFVEKGILDGKAVNAAIQKSLTKNIVSEIDVLALGCTHYPFLGGSIRAIVGSNVQVLDSGGAVARHVNKILEQNKMHAKGKVVNEFFTTGKTKQYSRVASTLLGKEVVVQYAKL